MVPNGLIEAENTSRDDQQYVADPKSFEHVWCVLSQVGIDALVKNGYGDKDYDDIEYPH